jgi:hypothetical protein
MMSSKCFKTKDSPSGRQLYIQVWYNLFQHVNKLYHTYIYSCLPEDEPSGSKHVEDIINMKVLV